MDYRYENWITINYPTKCSAYLQCEQATKKMTIEFPELKRVRGLISVEELYGFPPTKTPHWWCKTDSGNIVDPTSHQYPTRIIDYQEVNENEGSPTGKCLDCGDLCYRGKNFCCNGCERAFVKDLNKGRNKGRNKC